MDFLDVIEDIFLPQLVNACVLHEINLREKKIIRRYYAKQHVFDKILFTAIELPKRVGK